MASPYVVSSLRFRPPEHHKEPLTSAPGVSTSSWGVCTSNWGVYTSESSWSVLLVLAGVYPAQPCARRGNPRTKSRTPGPATS
eukprot:3074017-Rhodomonas_salina.2